MDQDEPRPSISRAFSLAKAVLLCLLVATLLADLPLTLVYSLNAQIRHLPSRGGPDGAFAGEIFQSERLPRTVAFNLEPEAVLQKRPAETPRPGVMQFMPAPSASLPSPGWVFRRSIALRHEAVRIPPKRRPYDPLAPPSQPV